MYPPPGSSDQAVTATPTMPETPAQASPSVGSGVGAPPPGGGSPGGTPASLTDRLQSAQAAIEAQQAATAQNPATDPGLPPAAAPAQPAAQQPPATPAVPQTPPPAPGQPQPAAGQPAAPAPEFVQLQQQHQQATQQLAQLQQAMAQLRQEASTLQGYAAIGYQQVMAQRQAAAPAAPAAPAQPASLTGVPEFDHRLTQFIYRDDQGNLALKPGAPPDTLARYHEYTAKTEDFFRNFARDPMAVIGQPIKEMIAAEATRLAQQQVAQVTTQRDLEGYVQANRHIFYERDAASGQELRDGYGRPVLSGVGRMFVETATGLARAGVTDPMAQRQMTEQIVLGQLALQRLQAGGQTPQQQQQLVAQVQQGQQAVAGVQQAAATAQPNPLALLAQGQRQAFVQNQGAAQAAAPGGPATPPSVTPMSIPAAHNGRAMSLTDMLAAAAPQYGIDMNLRG
jgi:hypothetical protein